jgi:hypothetical protein
MTTIQEQWTELEAATPNESAKPEEEATPNDSTEPSAFVVPMVLLSGAPKIPCSRRRQRGDLDRRRCPWRTLLTERATLASR